MGEGREEESHARDPGSEVPEADSPKEIAFYSAAVQAWIDTRMEKDRQLVVLSSAGLGLVVTLLTAVGPSSMLELGGASVAGLLFLAAIILGLSIFDRNGRHLEDVVRDRTAGRDPKLDRRDKWLQRTFLLGALTTAVVAGSAGYYRMQANRAEGGAVTMDKKQSRREGQSKQVQKSLSGISNLRPAPGDAPKGGADSAPDGSGSTPAAGENTSTSGTSKEQRS